MVAVAAPPVATMPVSDGIEKYAASQAAGAAVVMEASLVMVTVRLEAAATMRELVRLWTLPLVPVAKFQMTSLVDDEQPAIAPVSVAPVYPVANVELVGRSTPVMVTGNTLGLVMVSTTSPLAPGYRRLDADGDDTAATVTLLTVAPNPSAEEPALSPTIQFVTP